MDDLQNLRQRLAEISDLSRAAGVLGWDQRVTMPPLGTDSRAESLAALGGVILSHLFFVTKMQEFEALSNPRGAGPKTQSITP
jgi:Zn-dependent M32 family carboxypeptidase